MIEFVKWSMFCMAGEDRVICSHQRRERESAYEVVQVVPCMR